MRLENVQSNKTTMVSLLNFNKIYNKKSPPEAVYTILDKYHIIIYLIILKNRENTSNFHDRQNESKNM